VGALETARAFTTRDGATAAYRVLRSGPRRRLVVLLHGLASNLTRWSEFVARTSLTGSWDILRLDLRGHGGSLHRGRIGVDEWCADLAEILEAEGHRRAVLVGHCLGANVAIEFAHRHPDRAAGLVLVEPMLRQALTGAMGRIARLRPLFVPVARLIRALNALGLHRQHVAPLDLEALDRETRATMAQARTADALVKRYASPWLDLRTTASGAYLQSLIAVSGDLPDLATIRTPALALLSTGTAFSDPALTERLLAAMPNCAIVRLDAHHWIPTERPDEMRRAIEEFCQTDRQN
jgi:pimeloyl-ACP methyl ester carboxylesterase